MIIGGFGFDSFMSEWNFYVIIPSAICTAVLGDKYDGMTGYSPGLLHISAGCLLSVVCNRM